MKPLCIDLYCGLGGWAEGFLSEGYDVVGFDIERRPYPGQLVLQDVLTLHGRQFSDAAVIVASPPCQEYAKWGMPMFYPAPPIPNPACWDAAERIAREANRPIVIENVIGAQVHRGRARWHSGSYYFWGDVPALMPICAPRKDFGCGRDPEGRRDIKGGRRFSSRSPMRKLNSAIMAKIPFPLAQHIARVFKP